MTVLDRLLGRRPTTSDRHRANEGGSAECAQVAVTPRRDSLEDMGREDLATAFVCDACHQTLTPAEAERSKSEAANRLRLD